MSACMDPYESLGFVLNPDGTVTRLYQDPRTLPSPDPNLPNPNPNPVLSKDIIILNHTFFRLFLPRTALHNHKKLPLIVFYHGGGFVRLSAASAMFHDFCSNMAAALSAIVASLDYRLAPEHRLPAAYDNAVEALHWIKSNPDEDWLKTYADFSNCYLMGSSAGGNITYHAGLRAAAEDFDLDPENKFKIRGLILVQPFFGGIQRTASELRLQNDDVLPLCVTDLLWDLSLPIGVDRGHEYCNPTVGDGPERLEKIGRLGWRVLVTGCSGDLLIDRQVVAKLMEEKGVGVVTHFTEGDYHGVQDKDAKKAMQLFQLIKDFISATEQFT